MYKTAGVICISFATLIGMICDSTLLLGSAIRESAAVTAGIEYVPAESLEYSNTSRRYASVKNYVGPAQFLMFLGATLLGIGVVADLWKVFNYPSDSKSFFKNPPRFILLVITTLVLAGSALTAYFVYVNSPTRVGPIVEEFRPRYDARTEMLKKAAAALPPVGELEEQLLESPLDPTITFDDRNNKRPNVASMMIEELMPTGTRPLLIINAHPHFDRNFYKTSEWMEQPTKGLTTYGPEGYRDRLEWNVGLPYVLIHRASFRGAEDGGSSTDGVIDVETILVDMKTGKTLAAFTASQELSAGQTPFGSHHILINQIYTKLGDVSPYLQR